MNEGSDDVFALEAEAGECNECHTDKRQNRYDEGTEACRDVWMQPSEGRGGGGCELATHLAARRGFMVHNTSESRKT
jgi:hypothetical protein